jgi:enediyne biosynthesis protein E4
MIRAVVGSVLAALVACGTVPQRETRELPERPTRAPLTGPDMRACWRSEPAPGSPDISFVDVTSGRGVLGPLTGMHGHSAAWGDVDADGWTDLFVGTFADRPQEEYRMRGATGPAPDRLLLGGPAGFTVTPGFPSERGRTSGNALVDLDEDGDLDLVASRNTRPIPRGSAPTRVLENRSGAFRAVPHAGIPPDLVGRSVAVLDFDTDGDADLFIAEDRWSGGSGMLLRNEGGLRFEDATMAAGLPPDIQGLGVAAADLNVDGATDLFVAGSNRLFVAQDHGTFHEADPTVFRWETFGGEDDVSGVAVGDLNRDGRPDLVLGHHYNSTLDFGVRVPIRLYLNRGQNRKGDPTFEDVTERAGLAPLPTKAPHVEIADLDNDGWPDILTTASSHDGTRPAIFRHTGLRGGIPQFEAPEGLGDPQYWITGPTTDVDRDGRLDVFLVEWEPALPSILLHNETASGNWLEVAAPIGSRVLIRDQDRRLLGAAEITASEGFAAGVPGVAHFGVGPVEMVDLRIDLPSGEVVRSEEVPANRRLTAHGSCG